MALNLTVALTLSPLSQLLNCLLLPAAAAVFCEKAQINPCLYLKMSCQLYVSYQIKAKCLKVTFKIMWRLDQLSCFMHIEIELEKSYLNGVLILIFRIPQIPVRSCK